jgi:hypothetical protein
LQREELLNRNQIIISDEITNETEIASKHSDINIERATLFLSYLLDFAKVNSQSFNNKRKEISNSDKNKIIEFLTTYSGKQSNKLWAKFNTEKAKIQETEEIEEKFYQDMQVIRKYFDLLGLSEIINKIDADLGEK